MVKKFLAFGLFAWRKTVNGEGVPNGRGIAFARHAKPKKVGGG